MLGERGGRYDLRCLRPARPASWSLAWRIKRQRLGDWWPRSGLLQQCRPLGRLYQGQAGDLKPARVVFAVCAAIIDVHTEGTTGPSQGLYAV